MNNITNKTENIPVSALVRQEAAEEIAKTAAEAQANVPDYLLTDEERRQKYGGTPRTATTKTGLQTSTEEVLPPPPTSTEQRIVNAQRNLKITPAMIDPEEWATGQTRD